MIKYVLGDILTPVTDSALLIHCVNDLGVMGAGVALALAQKWPKVKQQYVAWHTNSSWNVSDAAPTPFALGETQFVKVDDNVTVGNMIAQHDIRVKEGVPPVRYPALERCLQTVAQVAKENDMTVHVPYLMCCDRAGGSWTKVETRLEAIVSKNACEIFVYDKFRKLSTHDIIQ